MATSDNKDTWPLDAGQPFWPGLFRQDKEGIIYNGEFTSERDLFCVFTDAGNENEYGIRVEQTAYSFARRYAEDFLIYRFNIKNTSNDTLFDLYPGMMVQFLIDFDNHDLIEFIDSNNDGKKDFIYMWDQDELPREPWSKVGYIGLVVVNAPTGNGITNFHFFHDDFMPSKDEDFWLLMTSDTTGLQDTTRAKYFHGDDVHLDDINLAPELDPDGQNRGTEISWAYSLGPVSLAPGDSLPLEIAIVCGDNKQDLLENVSWIWFLAENAWNGSNPPNPPLVEAYTGNGEVTVTWDAETSENTKDNISGDKDFEGYKIYRSTDGGKTWGKKITNVLGEFIGYKPLAQYDLINEISGIDPISNQYLGNNSGIQHTFIDTTVTNGIEYWYTVTAYDKGDKINQVESLESALGLTVNEVNVAAATPTSPPGNFSPGFLVDDSNILVPDSGFTEGEVKIEIIDHAQLKSRNYKITFNENTPIYESSLPIDTVTTFTLKDADMGEILLLENQLTDASGDNIPVIDGFRLIVQDVEAGKIITEWTKVNADTCNFYWNINPIGANDFPVVYFPANIQFKITIDTTASGGLTAKYYDLWSEVPTDSSLHLPLKIYVSGDNLDPIDISNNTWLGEFLSSPFGLLSPPGWDLIPGGAGFSSQFPFPDRIIMEYITAEMDTFGVRLVTNNGPDTAIPPSQGDEFTIRMSRAFTEEVVYTFSTMGGTYTQIDKQDLEQIKVVPNPFFVTSSFENRLMFTNLPNRCEIKIYNVAGDLVRSINHTNDTGSDFWDLKNDKGLAVSFGLYVFLVKAESGKKQTGKFSLIR
jgi:hypothetical protein